MRVVVETESAVRDDNASIVDSFHPGFLVAVQKYIQNSYSAWKKKIFFELQWENMFNLVKSAKTIFEEVSNKQ